MIIHTFDKRVRYGETDQMGYLYYGNYALLYEIGRAEAMRSIGMTYKQLELEQRIMMPVAYMTSKFIQPALYDELLTIKTMMKEVPTRMCQFEHEIFNEKKILINKGEVKLVFINMETGKPISAPSLLIEKIKPYFD